MEQNLGCKMEDCNINEIASDVKDIKHALLGDEFNPNGLVKQVQNHDTRLKILEKALYTLIGGGAVVVFASQILSSCN